jgi:hypothetical protein
VRLPAAVQTIVLALVALSRCCSCCCSVRDGPPRMASSSRGRGGARRRGRLLSLLPFVALLGAAWYYVATRVPGEDGHPIERAISAITG